MLNKKKLFSIGIIVILFTIFFVTNKQTEAVNVLGSSNFMGNYNGDVSIFYFTGDSKEGSIKDGNNYSTIFAPNKTNSQRYVFFADNIEISADQLLNETNKEKIIANNDSAQTNISNAIRVAQEFKVESLCSITLMWLYLNYSIRGNLLYPTILKTAISEEDLKTIIIEAEVPIYGQESHCGWKLFNFGSNILESFKTYYIIFQISFPFIGIEDNGVPIINPLSNHTWKAQLHNDSKYNVGNTLIYNGTTWDNITNDEVRDMLCYFNYDTVIDPYEINLQISINDELCGWQRRKPEWGSGYEVYYTGKFPIIPKNSLNITLKVNTTIPSLNINMEMQYVYLIPVTGWYNASYNRIDWSLIYPYRTISELWFPPGYVLAFEYDWDFIEFLDPQNETMSDVYFGPMSIYNQSYYVMLLWLFDWLEPGDHTGLFTSPNYCHSIQPKVKSESEFQAASSFELGQTVKLEALIKDTNNNPISGGNATINFTSPTGQIMSFPNLTSTNGVISTEEFLLETDLETGTYTISVFWTNGHEVGCYSFEIEVYPQSSMLMTYISIGILFALAIAAYPISIYTRRKIQTHNWKKYIRNLFILTKDGISIYGYSFGIEIQDPALVSAALMAISSFVLDAVKSKKELRIIDLEDKKVILSHGEHVITALISEKNFPIIQNRTEKFTKAFEAHYGRKLVGWKGNQSIFKDTDKLIQEYFPVSMEERITRGVKLKLIELYERIESATEPEVLVTIMKEITHLLQRYREIIEMYYMDEYAELMKIFDEKIST